MKYDLTREDELTAFKYKVHYLVENKKKVELKQVRESRTTQQNSSLHLYFTFIANELNDLGMEFQYFGVTGKALSMKYTPHIVKDYFWKPIQLTLFNVETTTKLDTNQMNNIIDIVTKFFADKGVVIPFPSLD
tara:strand:+ start:137 stop:535 length:399 start_codon:yes stop_codon:yes gene_type:complete